MSGNRNKLHSITDVGNMLEMSEVFCKKYNVNKTVTVLVIETGKFKQNCCLFGLSTGTNNPNTFIVPKREIITHGKLVHTLPIMIGNFINDKYIEMYGDPR